MNVQYAGRIPVHGIGRGGTDFAARRVGDLVNEMGGTGVSKSPVSRLSKEINPTGQDLPQPAARGRLTRRVGTGAYGDEAASLSRGIRSVR